MPKDKMWHGIPREEIPWYPTVDAATCIGCTLCYVTCGRLVYEMVENKAVAVRPYDCMVGCSTCGTVCPVEAISFPDRDLIWKLEREHRIFKVVRKEAEEKKERLEAMATRTEAEEKIADVSTRVRVELAGEFGEKRFLVKLEDLIRDRPFDVVNLRMEVPTVKGAMEKTPSVMWFEVTSTEQQDVEPFMAEVRSLVEENGLVLVNETRV
jgi:NAD-dependent dihydropyrimidine dehydrogenase PreA subunit